MPPPACPLVHAPQMSGTFKVDGSGNVELKEEDGIDYAATTVQLPGGERVPFLFTVKQLNAKGTLDAFGGEFTVPSYRGATFLDPKVRQGGGWQEGRGLEREWRPVAVDWTAGVCAAWWYREGGSQQAVSGGE